MGYFSNGCEGMDYEERYCMRCVHYGPKEGPGCPVWMAHLLRNYDECNNEDSILHMLIPRSADGGNEQCLMFVEAAGEISSRVAELEANLRHARDYCARPPGTCFDAILAGGGDPA